MADDRIQLAALDTVAAACTVARAVQRDLARVQRITKDDKSPVTVADFAVQAVVAMGLRNALGDTLIVGEEHSEALRGADQSHVLDAVIEAVRQFRQGVGRNEVLEAIDHCNHDATGDGYWTLDPIDGTKGFLRGQQYAIALARIDHGQVVAGVMGCPNLPMDHAAPLDIADSTGVMYWAAAGKGSWEQRCGDARTSPQQVHASRLQPGEAIRACESVESGHSKQDDTARILHELSGGIAAGPPARLDSQCKYAIVAHGQADVYLRLPTSKAYVEKIWDHAAGMIIAQEAGAIVSDIHGRALDFTHGRLLANNRGIVCAGAGLHARVIETIENLRIGAPA